MEARVTVQRMDTSGLAHLLEAVELLQLVAQVLQRACHRRSRHHQLVRLVKLFCLGEEQMNPLFWPLVTEALWHDNSSR